mgnify:CR=1 FL=1
MICVQTILQAGRFSRLFFSLFFYKISFPEIPGSVIWIGSRMRLSSSSSISFSFRIRLLTDSPVLIAFFAISAAF